MAPTGTGYTQHGVTRGSGDFGIDFIGELDIGEGFTPTPLVVLGQAARNASRPGQRLTRRTSRGR